MNADLVVIGGGPAGLSAAVTAASFGTKVIVIDENPKVGGKLRGQLHEHPGQGWWKGEEIAEQLSKEAYENDVTILREREVWGLFPGFRTILSHNEEIHSKYVLLATGAAERAIPIPGWTLPGVMAIGAAQVLANVHRVKPGKKALIIGADVLSLTIARQLQMAGVKVIGIVLPPPGLFSGKKSNPKFVLSTFANMTHLAPSLFLRTGGRFATNKHLLQMTSRFYPKNGLPIWGIPFMIRKAATKLIGENQVDSVSLAHLTSEGEIKEDSHQNVDVDCVCISGGLYPLTELAEAVGCKSAYLPGMGGRVPLYNSLLETTVQGIYVAGNITGIEGAPVAMAQGELAGTVIASKLHDVKGDVKQQIEEAQDKIKKIRQKADIQFNPDILEAKQHMEMLWKETVQG